MGIKEVNFFLSDVSDLSETIPFAMAVYAAVKKPPHHLWKWFFLVTAVIKIATLVLAKSRTNNMPLFHLLAIWEVAFLFVFYNRFLFSRIIWPALILIIAFNIGNTVLHETLFQFNGLAWSVNTMVLLALGLWAFARLTDQADSLPEKSPTFIINAGWMIYFAGALFTYMLGSSIFSSEARDFFHNAWIIQSSSNIVKNIIIAIGLNVASRNE